MTDDDTQRLLDKIMAALNLSDWTVLIGPLQKQLRELMQQSGSALLGEMELQPDESIFHLIDEGAVKVAQERAAEMVGMKLLRTIDEAGNQVSRLVENPNPKYAITDGTRTLLRSTVEKALLEGWPAGKLRQTLHENYAFSNDRAAAIARTEVSRAHGMGQQIAAEKSGVVKTKSWVKGSEHGGDDECDDNESDGDIPLNQAFSSGDMTEPAHPNCSCVVIYNTE
jgi:hypothetical protein